MRPHSSPQVITRVVTAMAALTGVVAIAACSSGGPSAGPTSAGGAAPNSAPIVVTATDTSCAVSASSAPAGTITFQVNNTGSKVNEFYVYAADDRIVGEIENITPGLSRELRVEVTAPGTFQTACKPGTVGDGIRSTFTVTGTAVSGSTS